MVDGKIDFDRIDAEKKPQAERIATWMRFRHPCKTVLDVGCGPGTYVRAMRAAGVRAFGCDSDPRTPFKEKKVDWVIPPGGDNFFYVELTSYPTLPDSDVALSLEVWEHIDINDHFSYVRALGTTGAEFLYFSAARPGQGGEGHINCQPKAFWVQALHEVGYWLDPDMTEEWLQFMRAGPHMGWLVQNGMIFRP